MLPARSPGVDLGRFLQPRGAFNPITEKSVEVRRLVLLHEVAAVLDDPQFAAGDECVEPLGAIHRNPGVIGAPDDQRRDRDPVVVGFDLVGDMAILDFGMGAPDVVARTWPWHRPCVSDRAQGVRRETIESCTPEKHPTCTRA